MKQNAREKIITTGVEMVAISGFNATGIDSILKAAGVPKGSFYHYFGSKENFGIEVINLFADRYAQRLHQYFDDQSVAPLERIRNYLEQTIEHLTEENFSKGCLIGTLGQELADQNERFRDRLAEVFCDWLELFADCLRQAQQAGSLSARLDAKKLASFLLSGWEGAVLRAKVMGCGSRAGKTEQHSNGKPNIDEAKCVGCRACIKQCANDALHFSAETKKTTINHDNCVGCGRCLGACNFDAISFSFDAAVEMLNCKMAEYTKAVVQGRPNFHISLIVDVSPNCDCHGENDAPILPNIGMFASFDPLALDQACVDACMKAKPLPGSQLAENLAKKGFVDHHDHFRNSRPESEWRTCLAHAEKIGLGTREYELIVVK